MTWERLLELVSGIGVYRQAYEGTLRLMVINEHLPQMNCDTGAALQRRKSVPRARM